MSEEKLRLGGMALRNGLLVHGPTHWAAAVRTTDGEIKVASGRKPHLNVAANIPGARGVLKLAEAFAVIPLVKRALPQAQMPFQDVSVIGVAAGATVAGTFARRRLRGASGEALAAAVSLAPAIFALRGGELAEYHGVEHKAIAAYEQDRDPSEVPKEHERCGSNLIAPMLVFSLAGQLIVDRLIENPGRIARGVSGVAGLSLSVETFVAAERHPDSALGRAIHASGHTIQRLIATREPTEEQLEVGVAALAAALEAEAG